MGGAEPPPRHKLFADVTWTRVNCNYLYLTVGLLHFATHGATLFYPFLRVFVLFLPSLRGRHLEQPGTINLGVRGKRFGRNPLWFRRNSSLP